MTLNRRQAMLHFWAFVAASPLVRAQQEGLPPRSVYLPDRITPREDIINALEVEDMARKMLPQPVFDHIAAGAGSEQTLRRNREFFERITFRPRMLVDVSKLDLSSKLFGQDLFAPILVAPTSHHGRIHPDAELATAEGAGAAKTVMVVSHRSSEPLEAIAKRAQAPLWFQADVEGDLGVTTEAVKRAVGAGCQVICLTVGSPYRPVLDRDVHNQYLGSSKPGSSGGGEATAAGSARAPDSASAPAGGNGWPPHPDRLVLQSSPRLNWGVLEQVKKAAGKPLVLKGILSPAEAQKAVAEGADGIVVSNHGGRAVDGVPATIEALPKVAEAVAGKVPLLVDGGFRRGADVFKGLALGADAVLLGRSVLWGLGAYGAAGVKKILELTQYELALAMGLSGQPNLAAISPKLVKIHRW